MNLQLLNIFHRHLQLQKRDNSNEFYCEATTYVTSRTEIFVSFCLARVNVEVNPIFY